MAEKPRLKKSDEILGSIAAEPKRASRKVGNVGSVENSADSEREKERQNRKPEPPILSGLQASGPLDDMDDDFEPSDQQVVLPSAQSLAEKLLARDDKSRRLNFEKYELPKREPTTAPTVPQGRAPAVYPAPSVPNPKTEPEPRPEPRTAPAVPVQTAKEPEPAPKPVRPVRASEPPARIEYSVSAETAPREQSAPVEFAPPTFASAQNVQFEFGDAADPVQTAPRHARPQRAISPRIAAPEPAAAPVISEYTFPSFDDEPPVATAREFSVGQDEPNESRENHRQPRERARRPSHTAQDAEIEFERETEIVREQPRIIRPQQPADTAAVNQPADRPGMGSQAPRPQPQPELPPQPAPQPVPQEETISEEERSRREFLNRISSQFELQFEEKFEQGSLRDRGKAQPPAADARSGRKAPPPPPPPVRQPPPREAIPEPANDEDFFTTVQRQRGRIEPPAPPDERPLRGMFEESGAGADFIAQFEQKTLDEERKREDDFKETLAEKFERERERYLKELEISQRGDEPPVLPDEGENPFVPPQQPQRRKLDFQIQPEMHTQDGVPPAARAARQASGPVTYTRGGTARPQTPAPDDGTGPRMAPNAPGTGVPPPQASGRKTSEQLLMELGRMPRSASPVPQAKPQPPLKFTFTTPEEQAQAAAAAEKPVKPARESLLPKEKWPRRIVLIAMAAGLLSIALLVWPLVKYIQLSNSLSNAAQPSSNAGAVEQDTLEVYENRSFTQTAKVSNVLFKNADVTLKNVDVSDYVIVDGITAKGKIRLENVNVGSAVSIKSTGISSLELFDVKAERVIINNASSDMTVTVTGATDIGVFEVRTATTVSQYDMSGDAPGVRAMTLTPPDGGTTVSAKLDGLSLNSLSTAANDSVLVFENDSRAETMSSDGSLSLSGSGRVMNLSVGAGISQGAGNVDTGKNINILIKDVLVTNLSVKSPANLNLATSVDSVTTSDPLNIGGSGSVGTLTLNQRYDGGRLSVDIAGLSIQSLYSNAQSRVNITGSAKVNVLTAEASAYILGNKVNKLIANANGVIYENRPDQVNVAEGMSPPQSVAENPNIDYGVGSSSSTGTETGGDFSTACGHSRESGGFTEGNGSKDAPFEVSTPLQLAHVSAHPDSYFIQTGDIDISNESSLANGFTPICSSVSSPFTGVYDGVGFAISNLRIVSSDKAAGLFGANRGTIQNVRLVSGEISSTSTAESYVGGIAGVNLDGGSIRSCSNGAAVIGNQYTYAGGIAGLSTGGRIHDCYNYGKISGLDGVGGIVGVNDGSSAITGSYNAGTIDGRNETGAVVGSNNTGSTVANCYYLEDTAPFGIGNGSGTATEKDPEELSSAQMAADLAAGNESSLWIAGASSGYRYPIHKKP